MSSPHCNGATLDQAANSPGSGNRFPHRIAEDDLRGRTSTGLSIDEIELLACQPAEKGEGGILRQSPKSLGFLRVLRSFFPLVCIPGDQETRRFLNLSASLGPIRRSRSPRWARPDHQGLRWRFVPDEPRPVVKGLLSDGNWAIYAHFEVYRP